ncbi:MAG TPA: hypothetical protein DCS93_38905 [Microscillaceae bacterium]|nr:hypothetical protein [Microscillaceae bacterium]
MKENKLTITYEEYARLKADFEEKERKFEAQLWVDSTLNKFDGLLRENYAKSLQEFASIVIQHIAELTNAFSGIMYTLDQDQKLLQATSGYAVSVETIEKRSFRVGEGVVGQAAASAKTLVFENIPAENVEVFFSSAKVNVANIRVIPLIFNEVVYGVLELIFITKLSDTHANLLEKMSRSIATMIESILNNDVNQKLLLDSQEQTDLLRAQEEELRQNLEEIAATQDLMNKQQRELELKETEMYKKMKQVNLEKEAMETREQKLQETLEKYQKDLETYKNKDQEIAQLQEELAKYKKINSTKAKA